VTETYVALKVFVDNWRWAGVPFYIRAGKRLPKKATEIAIQFHSSPHTPFGRQDTESLEPNVLVVRVQPEEGVSLKIGAKVPGSGFEVSSVNMDLLYGTAFLEEAPTPTSGYCSTSCSATRRSLSGPTRRRGRGASWTP
jgi:glucose-6-phosphate 1-dehydrogenase